MDAYHRDPHIEGMYGVPNFDIWELLREALRGQSKQALHTLWAERVRGKISPGMAKLAVMMIRKQQVSND